MAELLPVGSHNRFVVHVEISLGRTAGGDASRAGDTKDPSGWYLAASTHGTFSVLIPIPFNDYSVTDDDPKVGKIKTYIVGAKSAEGIKFSATETPIIEGRSPTNLASMPQQFRKPGWTVADIDTSLFASYPSVAFSVKGQSGGAYMCYVKTPKSLILVILEYPKDQAKGAEGFRSTFLSSLRIKKTERDGPANRSQPTRSETNRRHRRLALIADLCGAHPDTADFSLSPRRRSGERGDHSPPMALLSPALSSLGGRRGSAPTAKGAVSRCAQLCVRP